MRLESPVSLRRNVDEPDSPSFLTELLFPLPANRRTVLGIVTWWESRRLLYNLIVGACGLVTITVIIVASLVSGHDPFRESPVVPVLAYAFMANLCYTLGPLIEITLERVWKDRILPIGPALFRQGLAFAIGLTLLPIPLVIGMSMIRLASKLFFHW
jgi:hypothetical protein